MSMTPLPAAGTPLSAREVEVLRLVAVGKTNPQIAHELCIVVDTVRTHMQRISAKLNVSGRGAIVSAGYEHGWLRLPERVVLAQANELVARRVAAARSGRAA